MNCKCSRCLGVKDGLLKRNRLVFVFDPTDEWPHHIPNGKQTRRPGHIFYTPCTGIWQTVWLENTPSTYITSLDLTAGMDGNGRFHPFGNEQEG